MHVCLRHCPHPIPLTASMWRRVLGGLSWPRGVLQGLEPARSKPPVRNCVCLKRPRSPLQCLACPVVECGPQAGASMPLWVWHSHSFYVSLIRVYTHSPGQVVVSPFSPLLHKSGPRVKATRYDPPSFAAPSEAACCRFCSRSIRKERMFCGTVEGVVVQVRCLQGQGACSHHVALLSPSQRRSNGLKMGEGRASERTGRSKQRSRINATGVAPAAQPYGRHARASHGAGTRCNPPSTRCTPCSSRGWWGPYSRPCTARRMRRTGVRQIGGSAGVEQAAARLLIHREALGRTGWCQVLNPRTSRLTRRIPQAPQTHLQVVHPLVVAPGGVGEREVGRVH